MNPFLPPRSRQRRRLLQAGLAAVAAAAPLARAWPAARGLSAFETARDNGHRLAPIAPAPAAADAAAPTIRIDPQQRHQTIVGFGGALTDSAAYVLAQLPNAKRREVLKRYFDPHDGIGYTLARTHINSCDFSRASWALDDTAEDLTLAKFSLEPMRELLPLLHDARTIAGAKQFRLLASPWSPPAWMKTNGQMHGGGRLRSVCRDAWAQYYVRFVKALRDEQQLPVWALTVQNEPDAAQTWESCLYSPWEEHDFIANALGPALHDAGLADVKLYGWDHNRNGLEERAGVLLGNPQSAKYLAGIAIHWYQEEDFAASRRVLEKFPDTQILFTEGCAEGGPHFNEWEPAERYARNIIGDIGNGVCGFIDWNIALDLQGGPNHVGNFCHAPVLVDTNAGTVHYQPSFHYIAHFSRFVRPGAARIEHHSDAEGLQVLAFANPDGSVVTVVCNPGEEPRDFTLSNGAVSHACRVPSHAIQTYVQA